MNCPRCHSENCTKIRLRIYENGQRTQWHQCLICGHGVRGPISKRDWIPDPEPWDRDLQEQSWRQRQEEFANQREEERATWFREHDAYLQTEAWRALRRKVIERENGLCQGCRERRGFHVHHLTYARWKHELLIDLALLCEQCHDRAHDDRDLSRSA